MKYHKKWKRTALVSITPGWCSSKGGMKRTALAPWQPAVV